MTGNPPVNRMERDAELSKLERLELAHADEGQLVDYQLSNALAREKEDLQSGYFWRLPIVGSIMSVSIAVVATYWGFSPPAAILTYINADLGMNPSLFGNLAISQSLRPQRQFESLFSHLVNVFWYRHHPVRTNF
jgi:hypothetical protein